ncbi:hypothetical protein COU53_03500 [Candidatus Pacearchaeota archaeon CG10_big_fil_rev_8_21_14_0_10_30_48]|nr:MAG: hypothetical protein COU53_03500 [Candidatus Pacearchaeota archaeon CG10_big_fil_rev_8_21_14_0_10_30_48]
MVLCLDIGGTNIRIAEVSDGKVKNKQTITTPKTKKQIINSLFDLIDSYPKPKVICIGTAGFVKDGKIYGNPNIDLKNIDIREIISKKYKSKVYVDNDANCAGLGELYYGNGKNKKDFLLLTLGTGIGGAIMIDRKLYHGNGFAGEPGHMILNNKMLEKKYQTNKKSKKYNQIGEDLGIAILNISYVLDPEIVIIGGGLSSVKSIYSEIRKILIKNDLIKRKIPIVRAKLGDNVGLIGASLLTKLR